MRELVLALALQGQLVPQDRKEPAPKVPEKDLGFDGADENGSTQNDENAASAKLPPNWARVRVSQICRNRSGNSKLIKGKLYDAPGEDRFQGFSASGPDVWCDDWEFEGEAVIVSAVGARCGKAFKATGKWSAIANTQIVWPSIEFVTLDFFFLMLNNEKFWKRSGAAQPFVKVRATLAKYIGLPPLAEQRRIVAKVEELMALCDELEQRQQARQDTRQRLTHAAFHHLTAAKDPAEFRRYALLVTRHSSLLFDSVPQLRQVILQLAVQGLLVHQDPNDEPASQLVKRIQLEQAQQQAEGIYKSSKPLPPIGETDKPFPLPLGWEWFRLRSLVFTLGDGLHGTPEYSEGTDCHFINGNNLVDGRIVFKPHTKTVSLDEMQKHRKLMTLNTVLVSINGTLGSVAFYNNENVVLGKSACYFNLSSLVDKHFVRLVIESPYFVNYALENATGTTIRNLGLKAMNYFPVPLPPLAEQKRIVARVEELMRLCDVLEAQLSQSRTLGAHLLESTLHHLLAA
jgi:type I restriction enzyme S subunit